MGGKSLRRWAITAAVVLGLLAAPAGATAGTGVISGWVWDESSEEPIAGVRVVAGPTGRPATAEARSNEAGEFTIAGLDPGDYDVGFMPDENSGYVAEWYGDVPVQVLSEPVTVTEAEPSRVSGYLTLGSTISGRVSDRAGAPAGKACVAALTFERTANVILPLGSATTDAAGNYSIRRLAPGFYRLWFGPAEGPYGKCAGGARDSGYVAQWLDGMPDFFASMPVKLGLGKARTGVDVQIDRTGATATPGGGGAPNAGSGTGCVVPKVTGLKPAGARKALKRAHCKAGKTTRRAHPKVKRGRVIGTAPKAGTSLPAGATVALVVSRGPARGR